jgi:hypothetical protein
MERDISKGLLIFNADEMRWGNVPKTLPEAAAKETKEALGSRRIALSREALKLGLSLMVDDKAQSLEKFGGYYCLGQTITQLADVMLEQENLATFDDEVAELLS